MKSTKILIVLIALILMANAKRRHVSNHNSEEEGERFWGKMKERRSERDDDSDDFTDYAGTIWDSVEKTEEAEQITE